MPTDMDKNIGQMTIKLDNNNKWHQIMCNRIVFIFKWDFSDFEDMVSSINDEIYILMRREL
jgi:hypothetical protein